MRDIIHRIKGGLLPSAAVVVVLAVLPIAGLPPEYTLYLLLFFLYLSMANMWNLLCGYSGLISLCQPAFMGLAGYTIVVWAWHGLPIYLGIILGAIAAALFALLISIPVFRLSGIYFAIGTLIVTEAMKYLFLLWRPIGGSIHGGGAGYILKGANAFSSTDVYWLALGIATLSSLCMRMILRSKLGLGLAAIRDNDGTAASSGINVFKLKLYSFVIAAFITGIAGTIFYIYQSYIEPNSAFSVTWTMSIILATVMGGMSTENGPIIGTVIVVVLHFFLAKYAGISLLIQGSLLIIIMLLVPQGILGFIRETRPYRSLLQLDTRRAS